MSLPTKAIDRLFERLSATYGADWTRQWAGVPITDVKTAWAHELSAYGNRLDALAWALDNLPENCPNAIQFRNICRSAPAPVVAQLPEPKADPERLKRELMKLGDLRVQTVSSGPVDHRAWAKRLIAKHEGGERVSSCSLQMARNALRMDMGV